MDETHASLRSGFPQAAALNQAVADHRVNDPALEAVKTLDIGDANKFRRNGTTRTRFDGCRCFFRDSGFAFIGIRWHTRILA